MSKPIPECVLDEAKSIIYGDREQTYGAPDKNLNTIADLWQSYCVARGMQVTFTAYDVCMMMVLMKVARQASTHKLDNLVDICGYAALVERVKNHLEAPKVVFTGGGAGGSGSPFPPGRYDSR